MPTDAATAKKAKTENRAAITPYACPISLRRRRADSDRLPDSSRIIETDNKISRRSRVDAINRLLLTGALRAPKSIPLPAITRRTTDPQAELARPPSIEPMQS